MVKILITRLSLIALCQLCVLKGVAPADSDWPFPNDNNRHTYSAQKTGGDERHDISSRGDHSPAYSRAQGGYPVLEDALKLLLNEPRHAMSNSGVHPVIGGGEKNLPVYNEGSRTHANVLASGENDHLAYAIHKVPSSNGQSTQPEIEVQFGERMSPGASHEPPRPPPVKYEPVHSRDEHREEMLLQTPYKRYQEQTKDGRPVMVELSDDNSNAKSMYDFIAPLIRDKSVLESLRPHLDDRRHTRGGKPAGASQQSQPLYFQGEKKSVLTLNKPLLEQKEKIEELRQSLSDQRFSPVPHRPAPTPNHGEQRQLSLAQFLGGAGGYQGLSSAQEQQIPLVLFDPKGQDPKALLNTLEQLVLKRESGNYMNSLPVQFKLQNSRTQAPTHAMGQQAVLLGAGNNAKIQAPYRYRAPNDNIALNSYMSRNFGKQLDSEPRLLGAGSHSAGSSHPQLTQQHLIWRNAGAGVDIIPESTEQQSGRHVLHRYNGQSSSGEDDSSNGESRELSLQELERKRMELLELDRQQRRMIEKATRHQEARDQEFRRLLAAKQHKSSDTSTGNHLAQVVLSKPVGAIANAYRNGQSDQRWMNEEVSPKSMLIRNKLVDMDRIGPKGPVDVLHSIHEQPLHFQPSRPTDKASDVRWSAIESPLAYSQPSAGAQVDKTSQRVHYQIAPDVWAQAERVDSEYVRRLKDILLSQTQQNEPNVETIAVPMNIGTAPTAGALSADANDNSNWWSGDKYRMARDHVSRVVNGQSYSN